MEPRFSPPLHRQRHQFVIDFVKRNKPKKVADLGCSECTLLKTLKFHREIDLLVGVDVNGAKVKKKMYVCSKWLNRVLHYTIIGPPKRGKFNGLSHPTDRSPNLLHGLAPISTDYLQPSYDQLRIELYQGSVTQKDARLRGFDLVASIELIEHLTLADVELFSEVVFGYMTPKAVIISTPNSEFNALLPGVSHYRHIDHKFEWTRAEFRSWAMKVCLEHGYEVQFTGVGKAPHGQQDSVGFCSQIGVFHQLRGRDCHDMLLGSDAEDVFSYTLLYSVNYPSLHDNNILRRVLVSEVLYWAEKLKKRWVEEQAGGTCGAVVLCQTEGGACAEEMKGLMDCSDVSDSSEKMGSCTSHRYLLMDEPTIKLSQDGSAVLVNDYGQEEGEEEDYNLEDTGYAKTIQYSHSAEQEEDWEEND